MTFNHYALNVPASATAGAAKSGLGEMRYKAVTISGTFNATVVVEASMDGTNFAAVAAGLTVPGVVNVPMSCLAVRINNTAYVSGPPVAILGGAW